MLLHSKIMFPREKKFLDTKRCRNDWKQSPTSIPNISAHWNCFYTEFKLGTRSHGVNPDGRQKRSFWPDGHCAVCGNHFSTTFPAFPIGPVERKSSLISSHDGIYMLGGCMRRRRRHPTENELSCRIFAGF